MPVIRPAVNKTAKNENRLRFLWYIGVSCRADGEFGRLIRALNHSLKSYGGGALAVLFIWLLFVWLLLDMTSWVIRRNLFEKLTLALMYTACPCISRNLLKIHRDGWMLSFEVRDRTLLPSCLYPGLFVGYCWCGLCMIRPLKLRWLGWKSGCAGSMLW